jgi:23S rRNA pseudouridine955/2504/2580 synthase
VTKSLLTLTAPLPSHMQATWDFLGWSPKEASLDPFEDRE